MSLSVSACALRVKNNQPPTASPMTTTVAAVPRPSKSVDFVEGLSLSCRGGGPSRFGISLQPL